MADDKQVVPAADEVADKTDKPIEGKEDEREIPSDVADIVKAEKERLAADKKPDIKPAQTVEKNQPDEKYSKLEKNYKELQRHATQSSMKAAELEKKLNQVLEQVAKSTEKEIDPQEFIRDVNERGHLPIIELIGKETDKVRKALTEEFGKVTSAQEAKLLETEANLYVERLGKDQKNFPGFDELKEQFGDILDEANCPVPADAPVLDQLVQLYQIAKSRSADKAIVLAKQEGKDEAEKLIAKEAQANVAGGGKAAGVTEPDWDNMPLDKHRKALVALYGIRE